MRMNSMMRLKKHLKIILTKKKKRKKSLKLILLDSTFLNQLINLPIIGITILYRKGILEHVGLFQLHLFLSRKFIGSINGKLSYPKFTPPTGSMLKKYEGL